mgnify:CR=1 FL=1
MQKELSYTPLNTETQLIRPYQSVCSWMLANIKNNNAGNLNVHEVCVFLYKQRGLYSWLLLLTILIIYKEIRAQFHNNLIRLNFNPKYFRQNYMFFSQVY